MKRTRGYVEAVDYLTIRIEDTNCAEFLKKGGLSDRIRGGYSHHCLPINSRGTDIDELKFIGRCLNSDKHIVVSIFEIHHKREHKKGYGKTQIEFGHSGEDTEFYMRLRSENKPIEFKVKHFNLKNGHVYQVRRPSCIKAQNHCTRSRGKSNNGLMVIDCERQDVLNGKLDKHDTVYVEITKRDKKPDTCVDERNGYCCRYVNAEVKGGICRLYDRNRNRYGGNSFNKDNDRHGAFGFDHPNDKEKNVDIDSKGIEENGTEFNGEEASEVKTSPDASLKKEESVESKKEEPIVGQDIKKDNAAPLDNSEEEIEFEMEDEDVLKKDEPVAPTPETANQKKETAPIPVSPSNNASSPIQEVAAKKEGNVVEEEDDDKKRSHIMMKRDVIPDEENENELENDFELWQSTGSSKGGKKHNQDNELDDNDLFEEKSSKQKTSNNKNKNEEEEEEEEREVEEKKSKSSSAKPKAKSPMKSNPKEESEEEGESEEERNLLEKEDREEREKEKTKLKASNQKNNKNGNKKTEEEEEEEEKEVEAKKSKTSAKPKSKSPSAASKPTKEEEEEEKEEEEKRSKTSAQKSSTGLKFSKPVTVVLSDEEREAQEEKELLEKEEREEEEKENAIKHSQGMDEFTLDELAEDDPFSSEEDADKEKKNVSVKSGNKVVFMKGSKVEEKVSASPVKVVSSNSNVKPVQTQKLQETQQPPKMKMLPIEFQVNKPSKTEETKPVEVKVTKPAETKQAKPVDIKVTKPVEIKLSEPVEIVISQPTASKIEQVAKPSKIVEKEEEELSSEEKEGAEEVEDLFAEKDESEEEPTLKHSSKESSKESSSSKHNDEEDEEEVRQKEIEEKERKEEMEEREREEKEDAMILEKEKEEELQEKMSQEREERADREKAHQDVEDAEQVHDLLKSGKTMDQIKKEMNEDVVESKDTQKKSDSFVLNISKSVTPSDKNTLTQTNNKAIPAILADKSISIASTNLDMIQDGNEKVIDEAEAELDDEFAKKK